MGVVNTLSTAITNHDATPKVQNAAYYERGIKHTSVGIVEIAAADADTSTYRMVRLPSCARLISAKVFCDAITSGTSFDLGIYKPASLGGAVVDVDAFASAVDLSSAITAGTEIAFEALDISKADKRLWELPGVALTADPNIEYDIVFTANTVGSAAGTVVLQVDYTF